jgi:hypothetical protein
MAVQGSAKQRSAKIFGKGEILYRSSFEFQGIALSCMAVQCIAGQEKATR